MNNRIHDSRKYQPSAGNNFLFDANIWLSIYGPIAPYNDWRSKHYSNLLRTLQYRNCNVYTNSIIVSEYANRFARMEFEQQNKLNSKYKNFKEFRQSVDFKPIAPEITANMNKIISISKRCDYEIGNVDLLRLSFDYKTGNYDFNDLIFTEICKENNLILVTHDGDFKDSEIEIVTANRYMLKN